jgi:hypothetical protein
LIGLSDCPDGSVFHCAIDGSAEEMVVAGGEIPGVAAGLDRLAANWLGL